MDFSDFTLLVTCYNKEAYVKGFCDIAQVFLLNNGTIVVVDDGSTDSSLNQIAHLSVQYKNFQLCTTENFGSASARNLGLKHLKTEFFMFWDIDDEVDPVNIDLALHEFRQSKAQLAVANFSIIPGGNLGPMPLSSDYMKVVKIGDLRNQILETMGYWRYIYRKSFVIDHSRMRFVPTRDELNNNNFILDDLFWLIEVASSDADLLVYPEPLIIYQYRTNQNQSSEAWQHYQKQVVDLPAALCAFESYLQDKFSQDFAVRKKLYIFTLRKHFSYLNKSQKVTFLLNFRQGLTNNRQVGSLVFPIIYYSVFDFLKSIKTRLK